MTRSGDPSLRSSRRDVLALAAKAALSPLLLARCATAAKMASISVPEDAYQLDAAVTYFNHASIGTTPRVVREARARYAQICEENPWLYTWGGAWTELAEEARIKVARYMGCSSDELAILRSATEGMNVLAQGLPWKPGDEVLFSSLNHVGASACFEHWGRRLGYRVRRFGFPLSEVPSLDVEDVVRLHLDQIRDETRVLVFPHVDNMVGLRHPARRIVEGARARGVEFVFVDGAQSVGMFPLNVPHVGADAYVTSAHKWLQTPKGFGLMHVRAALLARLEPMMVTWGQQEWENSARRYEDYGTRELASVIALGDSADFQQKFNGEKAWRSRERLVDYLRSRVESAPDLVWRSPRRPELSASLAAVEARGKKPSEIVNDLFHQHGFVLRPFDKLKTMRLSFNVTNTPAEIDRLLRQLAA